jgi:hypothetical protein
MEYDQYIFLYIQSHAIAGRCAEAMDWILTSANNIRKRSLQRSEGISWKGYHELGEKR